MRELALAASLLSALLGVASTLALIKGTAVTPWEIQSYGGHSEPEKAFRRVARRWRVAGFVVLALAFLLSAAAAIAGYLT